MSKIRAVFILVMIMALSGYSFGKEVGSARNFEDKRYSGTWTITDIKEGQNIEVEILISSIKCPNCGFVEDKRQTYTFDHIETLKQGVTTIHYITSPSKRCIIMESYLTAPQIKERLGGE